MKATGLIIYALIVVMAITGYVKDIVKLCECDFEPSYKAEVFYGIGACTGLGMIFGWIDLGK